MSTKSEKIAFLGHQVSLCDREIERAKLLENTMCKILFYNGSYPNIDSIEVRETLREPLKNFLINHFESQKEKHYVEIQETLKNQ